MPTLCLAFGEKILVTNHLADKFNILFKLSQTFLNREQSPQTICLRICFNLEKYFARIIFSIGEWHTVTCCSNISKAGLIISRCRLNLATTFSKAVSRTTCSKSWRKFQTLLQYRKMLNSVFTFENKISFEIDLEIQF